MPIRLSNIRKTQDATIGADGLDSAQVTTIASGVGIQSFDTLDSLPISSLTAGDRAFVKANKRLYISNGSGWYNVALVNLTPTMSLSPSGTITLSTDGTASTVTITASDSDGVDADLTFSVESDGNMVGTGTTVTQDSSVFTITPLTADSGGVAGDFTLTFKTSDVFNTATQNASFSLAFSNIVDSSSPTVLSLKATGNSAVNSAITYQNASDVSTGFTEGDNGGGGPQASTFNPFRSGGHSLHFDGTGDYVTVADDASLELSNSDFTIELWMYKTSSAGPVILQKRSTGSAVGDWTLLAEYSGTDFEFWSYDYNSFSSVMLQGGTIVRNTWHHVAITRSGNTWTMWVDGTSVATVTSSITIGNNSTPVTLGRDNYGGGTRYFEGYLADVRIVIGSAQYTSAFTVPTESLTAITNTQLLAAQLPWLGDKSTNAHAITHYGNVSIEPFRPYKYAPWNSTDFIGSVYVPGSDQLEVSDHLTVADFGANNFTIEGWFWSDNTTQQYQFFFSGRGSSTYRLLVFGNNNTIAVYLSTNGSGWTNYNTSSGTFKEKNWTHIALVRNGGTATLYVNGKGTNVTTSLGSNSLAAPTAFFIGSDYQSTNAFGGYVSDVRVVKGTAVYSSDFTPPTAPLTAVTNTQLLMQNKTDANVFDAAAARVTKLYGNVVSSTTQRKFSTASSVYFDGTGDYIQVPYSPTLLPDEGDFTIEFWFYTPDATNRQDPYSIYTGTTGIGIILSYSSAGTVSTYHGNSVTQQSSGGQFSANTWHHLAVSRSGTTQKIFIDGTEIKSDTVSTDYDGATDLYIGMAGNGTLHYEGYIQDLRFTKGYARYTAAFTPPTAEFSL